MIVSALLLALVVVPGCFAPRRAARLLRVFERPFGRLGRRPGSAVALVGALAFTLNAAIALLGRIPEPVVVDELSYLLAADTFAHGRLTNPPHPLWTHFETIHVIQQPTYASKYFPGQGLLLALGQVVGGHPIVGVWLGAALAAMAVCWMCFGWLPPRWAVLAGFLAVVHPGMVRWSQRYWGGSLAMCGGALVLGGLGRALKDPRPRDGLAMGLGMAILSVTRPFEGGVLTVLALGVLGAWLIGRVRPPAPPPLEVIKMIGAPIAGVVLITAAAAGYFNWRVTGHPWLPPYMVHEATYGAAPRFIVEGAGPEPTYHHAAMRHYYVGWERAFYQERHSLAGYVHGRGRELGWLAEFYFPPPLVAFQLPLLALPWVARRRRMRLGLWLGAAFFAVLMLESILNAHYLAPAAGLLFVVVVEATRHLRCWRWHGRPTGLFLARAGLVVSLVFLPAFYATLSRIQWEDRARIVRQLEAAGGHHLVLVRYASERPTWAEWVANAADIDAAPVVWAREMDPAENRRLLDYFRDRRVWLLDADAPEKRLVPYD